MVITVANFAGDHIGCSFSVLSCNVFIKVFWAHGQQQPADGPAKLTLLSNQLWQICMERLLYAQRQAGSPGTCSLIANKEEGD